MATAAASAASSAETARPAPLACDGCRRKHLKCDGASPTCGRCLVDGLACSYTASRRGLGHRSKRRDVASPLHQHRGHRPLPAAVGSGPAVDTTAAAQSATSITNDAPGSLRNHQMPLPSFTAPPPMTWALDASDHDRLLSLFYVHFFAAHPFLVPRSFYAVQQYPHYLDLVVCFVGFHYETTMPGALGLRDAVSTAMSEPDEQTISRVQALVLYAIILHVRQQAKEAGVCISRAANIALRLGMHEPTFAREHSACSPLVQESLRRTWWELYTVDIFIAALNRRPTFHTACTKSFPLLPCAQVLYEAGECDPNPATLQAFENRIFSPEPQTRFSPLCFRIDAIRVVSRVLAVAFQDDALPDDIQALDNALAGWDYNIPLWYRDVVGPSGDVDPMLFEARCFIDCATIFLHFPRSDLPNTVPLAKDIACADGYTQLAPTSRHHTVKAIAASKDLANLATMPWLLDRHSPFFVCGLVLGCITQLAAGSIHVRRNGLDCLQQHKDRVALMLGALQRLGERWQLAQNAARCLKAVAEATYSAQDGDDALSPRAVSFQDSGMADSDSMGNNPTWYDLFSMDEVPSGFFDNML